MLNRTEIQKSFSYNGVLLVVLNALIFDLLVIGYAGNSDSAAMSALLSNLTIGAFFEAALALVSVFAFYIIVLKEPLVWVLSRIYFIVILWRVFAYPILRVEDKVVWNKKPVQVTLKEWRVTRRFQLSREAGHAVWIPRQHLAVATFFVTLLSLASPFFGFQSLGYRLVPQVLDHLGIPGYFQWVWGFFLAAAICIICSKAMMASLGEHDKGRELFVNRVDNTFALQWIDQYLDGLKKALPPIRELLGDNRFGNTEEEASLVEGAEKAILDIIASMTVVREKIRKDVLSDNSEFMRALANAMRANH